MSIFRGGGTKIFGEKRLIKQGGSVQGQLRFAKGMASEKDRRLCGKGKKSPERREGESDTMPAKTICPSGEKNKERVLS